MGSAKDVNCHFSGTKTRKHVNPALTELTIKLGKEDVYVVLLIYLCGMANSV